MQKHEIIKYASELFFRYGIKSVGMDQIATGLGISKRTIYEQFESKDRLVSECLDQIRVYCQHEMTRIEQLAPGDRLKNIFEIYLRCYEGFYNLSPTFYRDLIQSRAGMKVIEQIRESVMETSQRIYWEAADAGVFRNRDDFKMIAVMWDCYNGNNMREDWQKRATPDAFARMLSACLHSLATEQGKTILENLINKQQINK